MSIHRRRIWGGVGIMALMAGAALVLALAGERDLRAADAAAPALDKEAWKKLIDDKGIASILKVQADVMEKSMKSAGTFRRALKKMEITGRIVAVLGNVETYRLEGDAAKKGAALREAGLALTKAAQDKTFEEAQKAFDAIKSYPDKIAAAADANPVDWTKMLDIDGLMTGVATADTESKRIAAAGKPADFKKEADAGEAYAHLLAVLGVVSREYETDENWKKWCDEMTTGSVAFAGAFQKKDQDTAKSARDTLMKSCEACHEAYRVEE